MLRHLIVPDGVELHIGDDENILRHVILRQPHTASRSQDEIEHGFKIGVGVVRMTERPFQVMDQPAVVAQLDEVGPRGELDVLVPVAAVHMRCEVHRKCDGNINGFHGRTASDRSHHRTGCIAYDERIASVPDIIGKRVPHQLKVVILCDHGSRTAKRIEALLLAVLCNDLVRIKRSGIDLRRTLLDGLKEGSSARLIVAKERLVVIEVRPGRNRAVIDLAPPVFAHLAFRDAEIAAQRGKRMLITGDGGMEVADDPACRRALSFIRRADGWEPLGKQRDRLALREVPLIGNELGANLLHHVILERRIHQRIDEIIPAAILRNETDQRADDGRFAAGQMMQADAEEPPFPHAVSADITGEEEPRDCKLRILRIGPIEHGDGFLRGFAAQGRDGEVQIEQGLARGLVAECAVFRLRKVAFRTEKLLLELIHEVIHRHFPFCSVHADFIYA